MGDLSENFSRDEFRSKDGLPYDTVDAELLRVLQHVRTHFGRAVVVVSGHRSPQHNKRVGGANNSLHLSGRAADISVASHSPKDVADYVRANFPHVSVGRYPTFTHIDTRTGTPAFWGNN